VYDEAKCAESRVEVVLQINGKIRSKVTVAKNTSDVELERLALDDANIKRYTDGKRIIKRIIIQNKLVNIVIAG
jgi:leucyl-tRNA synthetase